MRRVHSVKVSVYSEHDNSAVVSFVSLSTFEALDGVVESSVGRVEHEGLISYNFRALPASVIKVIIYLQHIVGRESTESVDVVCWRLFLEIFGLLMLDDHLVSHKCFLSGSKGTLHNKVKSNLFVLTKCIFASLALSRDYYSFIIILLFNLINYK